MAFPASAPIIVSHIHDSTADSLASYRSYPHTLLPDISHSVAYIFQFALSNLCIRYRHPTRAYRPAPSHPQGSRRALLQTHTSPWPSPLAIGRTQGLLMLKILPSIDQVSLRYNCFCCRTNSPITHRSCRCFRERTLKSTLSLYSLINRRFRSTYWIYVFIAFLIVFTLGFRFRMKVRNSFLAFFRYVLGFS